MPNSPINPRYIAYATYHGNTPQQQIEKDRKEWGEAYMIPFTLWDRRDESGNSKAHPNAFVA